jgi:hypothetical protein
MKAEPSWSRQVMAPASYKSVLAISSSFPVRFLRSFSYLNDRIRAEAYKDPERCPATLSAEPSGEETEEI